MSRQYLCDECAYVQTEPMAYRLTQLVEPEDADDDEPDDEFATVTYHFCSTPCLDRFVMAIPREFVDTEATEGEA